MKGMQHRSVGESVLRLTHCIVTCCAVDECGMLPGQFTQQLRNLNKALDELTVI